MSLENDPLDRKRRQLEPPALKRSTLRLPAQLRTAPETEAITHGA